MQQDSNPSTVQAVAQSKNCTENLNSICCAGSCQPGLEHGSFGLQAHQLTGQSIIRLHFDLCIRDSEIVMINLALNVDEINQRDLAEALSSLALLNHEPEADSMNDMLHQLTNLLQDFGETLSLSSILLLTPAMSLNVYL